jgi:hypothetical protein
MKMLWNNKWGLVTALGLSCIVVVTVLPSLVQEYRIQPFPSSDQIKKVSARPDLGRVEDGHDLMEKRSQDLSGMGGTDCGTVGISQNPELATKCALHAFWQAEPFRVRCDLMGIDSSVAEGIVGSPGGQVYALTFDGDPAGHEGTSRSQTMGGSEKLPNASPPLGQFGGPARVLSIMIFHL